MKQCQFSSLKLCWTYSNDLKQSALIVRALNLNVGLQEYIVVYITTLKSIGMIMSDGVLVIRSEAKKGGACC